MPDEIADDDMFETTSGEHITKLANGVSEVMAAAAKDGCSPSEIISVAFQVVADHARLRYGNGCLGAFAELIMRRASAPMPVEVPSGHA